MTSLQEKLREEPFFWSRLGFCYDPPRADAEGNQIIFSREFAEYNRIHRDFAAAGVKYHTTILHSGWVADGVWDYTLTDEVLDAIFDGNPDIYYMPRVKLNVPPDWCRNHPEDTFVYFNGPRTAEDIAGLVETAEHDYFGFTTEGYAVNGGKGVWKDDRVNHGSQIGLQSFSSKKWIADASETLYKLLVHLAESKYRDRIIGVHVAYGMCGETNLWGSWSPMGEGRRGDYGITNRAEFVKYGVKKYGSEEKALEKWGSLEPPEPQSRQKTGNCLREQFFEPDSYVSDYFEFVSDTNVDAIEAYCKVVKDASVLFGHELAAGVFYGYMYLYQAPNAGHLAIQRIIDSPYVDFISSPKGYYRCLAGEPGGEQGPSESMALKKCWLDEIDCWTHLDRRSNGKANNIEESKTLLWREAIKNLTHKQGFWWMDLGEGWYDDPELMEEIRCLTELGRKHDRDKQKSVAEVLLVVDEHSLASMNISYGLDKGLMFELHSELKLIGAPVDTLRLDDLFSVDLSQYKMIVFANCFKIERKRREQLVARIHNKLVVWHYAAGILAPEYDEDNFTTLTGFGIHEIVRPDAQFAGYPSLKYDENYKQVVGDFPLFVPVKEGMEVINHYPFGEHEPMTVLYDNVCVCACPSLSRKELRMLAKRAGVQILCDADCTVYADTNLCGFFPREEYIGEIMLPNGTGYDVSIPPRGRLVYWNGKKI